MPRLPRPFRRLLPLAALALLAACANPADNKPVATVSTPPPAQPAATAAPAVQAPAAPAAAAASTTRTLVIAPADSKLEFTGSKVTGSHAGGFKQFSGTIALADAAPERSSVRLEILTDSLWSDNERLTGHLKSADFFDVAQFPTAAFTSTAIARTAGGYDVTGDLTLRGVTRRITFPAQITVEPSAPGGPTVRTQAEFVIKRMDFGIVYPGKADDLIRDEVVIKFDITARPA